MKFKKLLPVILLLACFAARGNPVVYDDSKGLSNNQISRIAKDKTGLIWIATESGLNSFDGYNFKEIPELKGIKISTLCYDPVKHILWTGTARGLYTIDLQTGLVTGYSVTLKGNNVQEIIRYNDEVYCVFFSGDVIRINPDRSYKVLFSLQQAGITQGGIRKHFATDGRGNIFLSPDKSDVLIILNLPSSNFRQVPVDPDKIWGLTSANGLCIGQLRDGGITSWSWGKSSHLPAVLSDPSLKLGVLEDAGDGSWYLSIRGKYGLYRKDSVLRLVINDEFLFKSKVITTIFKDAHQVLWVGTNKGLVKINLQPLPGFKTIFEGYGPPVSTRQIVTGASQDEIYIATYNGIYLHNRVTGATALVDPGHISSAFPLYTRTLLYDSRYLYAGTESNEYYFYRYNLSKKKYEYGFFNIKPAGAQINSVYRMIPDKYGQIWMATDKGLATFNPVTSTITLHTTGKFSVGNTRLFYISLSRTPGKCWLAGRDGIFLVDLEKGVERAYRPYPTGSMSLPADDYIFVEEDPEGNAWVGSKKSGLIMLNAGSEVMMVINRSNGLSSNEVYGVLWQDKNTGWVSSVNGLCRYDKRARSFTDFFIEHGLSDNEFNQNSLLKHPSGIFYFGGINGVNYFDPQTVSGEQEPVYIFAASVSKWDKSVQQFTSMSPHEKIRLSPNDHLLTFTFGLSDYSQTESNAYFYRIKGLYDQWISLGSQNILRMEGLPAGTYQIEVTGFNKRGKQAVTPLEFTVDIEQVFYKIWWFYVLVALGVIGMVYVYFKWRLRNVHQKQQLRTQIASNLHDEVGSLLTSIIISTDSARYSARTVEEKNSKLERISALSRDATNTMSDVLWSIDARNDYAGNLTDRMREHAEMMLFPLNIEVEFDFTATQQNRNIKPDIRQQLYLIFKESINNIAKHSKASIVEVHYKQQGNDFELRISNNNHQSSQDNPVIMGQGLKNMQMRAEKIKATCTVETVDGLYVVTIRSQR